MSDSVPSLPAELHMEEEEEAQVIPAEPVKEKESSDDNGKGSNDSKNDQPEVIEILPGQIKSKNSKESNESRPEEITAREDQILQSPNKEFEEIKSPLSPPERLVVEEEGQTQLRLDGASPEKSEPRSQGVLVLNEPIPIKQEEQRPAEPVFQQPQVIIEQPRPSSDITTGDASGANHLSQNTLGSDETRPASGGFTIKEPSSPVHVQQAIIQHPQPNSETHISAPPEEDIRSIRLSDVDRESILRSNSRYIAFDTSQATRPVEQEHPEIKPCYCVLI